MVKDREAVITIGNKDPFIYAWSLLCMGKYHDTVTIKCMEYNEVKLNMLISAFRPWGIVEKGRERVCEQVKKGKPKVTSIHVRLDKLPEVKALRG